MVDQHCAIDGALPFSSLSADQECINRLASTLLQSTTISLSMSVDRSPELCVLVDSTSMQHTVVVMY